MVTLKSMQEFYAYMNKIRESFSPNQEYESPRLNQSREFRQVDRIDLRELPQRAVVFLKGAHQGEDYRIRLTDGKNIDIWRNIDANGLTAPLESIASTEGFIFEEGIIVKRKQLVVPYFRYEGSRVEKPTDLGFSVPLVVLVQYSQ
jgi:hypothetical protein